MKKYKVFTVIALMVVIFLTGSQSRPEKVSSSAEARSHVTDLDQTPFKSSVIIPIASNKKDFGSGAVIGKNTVLTAKHVVDTEEKKEYKTVEVLYGLTDKTGKEEFTSFPVKKVHYAKEGVDIAVLELGRNDKGQSIGELSPVAILNDSLQVQQMDSVTIAGFPGDKSFGSFWLSAGLVESNEGGLLMTTAYAVGGNSGSPIYNEKHEIIGVISAGTGGGSIATLISDHKTFIDQYVE